MPTPCSPTDALRPTARASLVATFDKGWRRAGDATGDAITVVLAHAHDWLPWLPDAHRLLSAAEAARVHRRRFAHDRDALALAYALHRLALAKLLRLSAAAVPLDRDARGCPRLADDLGFTSLSHADGLIAIATTTSGPVGIDIEPSGRADALLGIADCVVHAREAAGLSRWPAPARAVALLEIWVRKEAALKAAGVGLSIPMQTFAAPEHAALKLPALCCAPMQIRMLDGGRDCVAAVAGPAGASIRCDWVRPALCSHFVDTLPGVRNANSALTVAEHATP